MLLTNPQNRKIMKKILTITLFAFALVFATSCKEKINSSNDLKNTQWEARQEIPELSVPLTLLVEIDFDADNTFSLNLDFDTHGLDIPGLDEEIDLGEDIEGTWVYDKPNVYLTAEGETITAVVEGNTMTIHEPGIEEEFGEKIVFTKK